MYDMYTLMATIQAKTSRGQKYWYIVESRRVNGKPRPIVLAYLGKADDLLRRLQGLSEGLKLKSYSHGAVCALLTIAHKLDVISVVNKHIKSTRSYVSNQPIRNHLTAGITFLLAAIGRVCMPTSKRGWQNWAKTTSLEYLLRCNLSKIDSQHFWDLMDTLSANNIEKIESELLKQVLQEYSTIEKDSLFFDTTNFFTFIDTTNDNCSIARRGKNKQKRNDLRQIGLALVVTRKDLLPLLHYTYRGNMSDTVVFEEIIEKIKNRIVDLGLELSNHTLVFDRGNNSKKNLNIVKKFKLYYVGALTPHHHKKLINDADGNYKEVDIEHKTFMVFRDKRVVWKEERTVLVFVSDELKAGQIRGIYQSLAKKELQLQALKESLLNPKSKPRTKQELTEKIEKIIKGQYLNNVIEWSLSINSDKKYSLDFTINKEKLNEIKDTLGFRILMTNRHEWKTAEIINAYHGQSKIEYAFKNLKNPYHLSCRPQFHWTDQKIKVHIFICVLGYLLATIVQHKLRLTNNFKGNLSHLLDELNEIRLATLLEDSNKQGRVKAIYKLEEMSKEQKAIIEALEIENFHKERPKFNNVGVYN